MMAPQDTSRHPDLIFTDPYSPPTAKLAFEPLPPLRLLSDAVHHRHHHPFDDRPLLGPHDHGQLLHLRGNSDQAVPRAAEHMFFLSSVHTTPFMPPVTPIFLPQYDQQPPHVLPPPPPPSQQQQQQQFVLEDASRHDIVFVETTFDSSPSPSSTGASPSSLHPKVVTPVPVPNLTKKSRGRRVPTSTSLEHLSSLRGASRPHICEVPDCGKRFSRGEHLKRHVRSIHTNEKPYKCPVLKCNKAFSRHDNLAQHQKVHTQK